jgi:hypothetical protein
VGTWHDPDLGRPIAPPLEHCAELLGIDLATVHELAAKVEPYFRADGTRIWSLMQLERQLRPEAYAAPGRLSRPPTDPGRRCLVIPGVRARSMRAAKPLRPSRRKLASDPLHAI